MTVLHTISNDRLPTHLPVCILQQLKNRNPEYVEDTIATQLQNKVHLKIFQGFLQN